MFDDGTLLCFLWKGMINRFMKIFEVIARLPNKFWLNPKTSDLVACGDHCCSVLENKLNLPVNEVQEWIEHLSQYKNNDDEYNSALDENQSDILELAMKYGWVRGGNDGSPFLQSNKMIYLKSAAQYLRDMYNINKLIIECGDGNRVINQTLEGHEIDNFIRSRK